MIRVRKLTGALSEYEIPENATAKYLKDLISKKENIPLSDLVLQFRSRVIDNSELVSSLNLTPSDFLIFYSLSIKRKIENSNFSTCFPLSSSTGEPYNKQQMIQYIEALQFTHEHAVKALEFCKYDLNRTVTMLVSGELDEAGGEEAPKPERDYAADTGPSYNDVVRDHRTKRQVNDFFKTCTKEQYDAIERLLRVNKDKSVVVQVYIACGMDEEATANCLATM